MLETQLIIIVLINLLDQSYDILIVFTNPHNLGVEIFNCSVINDNPMERHMVSLICTLFFFCSTSDYPQIGFTVFFDPQNMGCRHPCWAVICDIDWAINRYTFFGNGGANLHTKLSEDPDLLLYHSQWTTVYT